MSKLYPESKVEVRGWEARNYDSLMDIITLGRYRGFIRDAIAAMGLEPGERILDLGAGTGRNAALMLEHVGEAGWITAWEIGEDMRRAFGARLGDRPNVELVDRRIDLPKEDFERPYDRVFISFVLHGLPHESRLVVLDNAFAALRPGGRFHILDYTEGPVDAPPFYRRWFLKYAECPYAVDFVERDWGSILSGAGFLEPSRRFFMRKIVQLLTVRKPA